MFVCENCAMFMGERAHLGFIEHVSFFADPDWNVLFGGCCNSATFGRFSTNIS